MGLKNNGMPVLELRVALTRDYERAVEFYCVGLGIEPAQNGQMTAGMG